MIYLFSGDDTKKKRLFYEKFIKSIPADTEIFFINRNYFDAAQIESLYSGSSLFSALCAAVFDNIFEQEEMGDFVLQKLALMRQWSNSFIFLEGKLNKEILDSFKKAKAELNIFELPKEKKEKFDNWLVPNAYLAKDRLNLWIYFRQAVDRGVVMEELIGVLFWKIKDAILRRDFRKFSEVELKNSAARLSYLLPQARKECRDAEAVFEQFLLKAF